MRKISRNQIFIAVLGALFFIIAALYMSGLRTQRYHVTPMPEENGMFPGDSKVSYHQTIVPNEDTILGIALMMMKREGSTYSLDVSLVDSETGMTLGNWSRSAEDFDESGREVFLLDHAITGVAGKELRMNMIIHPDSGPKISICTTTDELSYLGGLIFNEQLYKEGLNLQLAICTPSVRSLHILICLAAAMVTAALLLLILHRKPEYVLPAFLAIVGTVYFLAIPIMQVPDEVGHYLRSYEISQGDFLTPRNVDGTGYSLLPRNIIPEMYTDHHHLTYSEVAESFDERLISKKKDVIANATQALYSPVSYFPQAIGCLIGRLVTDKTVVVFYLGRLVSFLFCASISVLAVKWMPIGKRFLLLMVCMPMYLQQMVSLSSDALINAGAFLLIALVLKLREQEHISTAEKVMLASLSGTIALCKVVYLPLCFLCFAIPSEKLGKTRKRGLAFQILLALVCAALNIGWLFIGFRYMIEFRPGVNTPKQLAGVLRNPIGYLMVILRTCTNKLADWLGTMVGAKLCTQRVYTSMILTVLYLLMLAGEAVFLVPGERHNLSRRMRVIMAGLFLLIWGITLSSLYVQWTPVGSPQIEGFQGRYFIPILPLAALALKGKNIPLEEKDIQGSELVLATAINAAALFGVVTYYF